MYGVTEEWKVAMDRNQWRIIGVVGSRSRDTFEDEELVYGQIKKLWIKGETIICSGGCMAGADAFAKRICFVHQLPYLEFPAEWARKGKSAGFQRNGIIAEWSEFLIACVSKDRTGGTEDTIKKYTNIKGTEKLFLV